MNAVARPSFTLRGRLHLARAAWLAVCVPAMTLTVLGVPFTYRLHRMLFFYDAAERAAIHANLARLGLSLRFLATYWTVVEGVFTLVCFALGLLIVRRGPTDPMALFVSLVLVLLGATISGFVDALFLLHPGWQVTSNVLSAISVATTFVFFFVFPDGRFVPRWMRPEAGVFAFLATGLMFLGDEVSGLLMVVVVAWLLLGVSAQVYRYRRVSGPAARQQAKWVSLGFAVALAGLLTVTAAVWGFNVAEPGSLPHLAATTSQYLFMLLIPLTITVAILRHRLFDIDALINRTLVYGALTACVVGGYVLVVGYLGTLLGTDTNLMVSLIATGVVAALFAPLRDRLQRGVNRLMYGERDEPYRALARLGQRLEASLDPDAVLPTVVRTIQEALKLPYVALVLGQGDASRIVASAGTPRSEPLRLPLLYRNDPVGLLIVGQRDPDQGLSPDDRRLLADLARQAGVAVHAVQLSADLQRSREQLVTAREEERRRLRRDLHDGLGSRLVALNLQAGPLRGLIRRDPDAAIEVVVELRQELRTAIADIRRLVYELRPPALDELGLVAAIDQRVAQCRAPNAVTGYGAIDDEWPHLEVTVEAEEPLPLLSAAVEVAAYRIAEEALTNAVRHARARRCLVRLAVDDRALRLEIVDDGVGLSAAGRAGVGLLSMRERAAELGGTWSIEDAPAGGTRVLARLPLPEE